MPVREARGERLHLLLIREAEVKDVDLVRGVAREEEEVQEQRRAEQVAKLFATELRKKIAVAYTPRASDFMQGQVENALELGIKLS